MYLLDTDHLSLIQRGHSELKYKLSQVPAKNIAISIISVEEQLRGRLAQIHKANTSQARIVAYEQLDKTMRFLHAVPVIHYDLRAENYFQQFKSQKLKVGSMDLKIAAIALANHCVLVTRNYKDFSLINELKIEDWS